jgi:hypothetical protein
MECYLFAFRQQVVRRSAASPFETAGGTQLFLLFTLCQAFELVLLQQHAFKVPAEGTEHLRLQQPFVSECVCGGANPPHGTLAN